MTQRDRVLSDLADGQWKCGTYWLSRYLYVYSQRISEVNAREADRIESRPCQQHDHGVYEYRDTWAAQPEQRELALGAA